MADEIYAPVAPELASVVHPTANGIGIFPKLFAHEAEPIILKKNLLSIAGDSFYIQTGEGRPLFEVKGEAMSDTGRKHFHDINGNLLFDIKHEHFGFPHVTYYGEDSHGKKLFEVKQKKKLIGSKAICSFTSADGNANHLTIEGNFFSNKATITSDTGMVAATIDREWKHAKDAIAHEQTYAVVVSPHVDMALICAMCICLDEMKSEH